MQEQRLSDEVRRRAFDCCEYCQMPQRFYRQRFQIDHVIARQHGGVSELTNLALACMHCNRRKGPNVAGVNLDSGEVIRLFNPRRDRWDEHFRWDGVVIVGLTAPGRVCVAVLDMNHPDMIAVRSELARERAFPFTPV